MNKTKCNPQDVHRKHEHFYTWKSKKIFMHTSVFNDLETSQQFFIYANLHLAVYILSALSNLTL